MLSFSDVIALIALAVSAYAAWKTISFNEQQKSLIESQERLNRLLLEKEQSDALAARKADLSAAFIRLGNNRHRLKVFNKGKSPAKNVTIEFPDGNDLVPESEIRDKFPLEVLDAHQAVDLIAAVHNQTKRKQTVVLKWQDDLSDSNEKSVAVTL